MRTSQGVEYAAPLRADRITAGRTYYQQKQPTAPFMVVWISAFYESCAIQWQRTRVAIVRDNQGFYFGKQIAATLGYFEVEGV